MSNRAISIIINGVNNTRGAFAGVGRGLSSLRSQVTSTGAAIGGALGAFGVVRFLQSSVDAFADAEQSASRLRGVLESTGHAAGLAFRQIDNFASTREALTRFDADATKAGASVLATFTRIRGPEFLQAMRAAQDMSTIVGGDLRSSVMQLGKALNDPIKGLSALSKAGASFTAQQKANIQSLVELGRTAEAQKLILAELNVEFGGAAQRDAETMAGKIDQMKNAWGALKEQVGEALAPSLTTTMEFLARSLKAHDIDSLLSQVRAFGQTPASISGQTVERIESDVLLINELQASLRKELERTDVQLKSQAKTWLGASSALEHYSRTVFQSINALERAREVRLDVPIVAPPTRPIVAPPPGFDRDEYQRQQAARSVFEAERRSRVSQSLAGDARGLFRSLLQPLRDRQAFNLGREIGADLAGLIKGSGASSPSLFATESRFMSRGGKDPQADVKKSVDQVGRQMKDAVALIDKAVDALQQMASQQTTVELIEGAAGL